MTLLVRYEPAQPLSQLLAQVLVCVDRQYPLPPRLLVGEDGGGLGVADQRAHEDPAAVALRDPERSVLALPVVHEHDSIDDPLETLQTPLYDGLLIAHHEACRH